jgi:hypothetical protein
VCVPYRRETDERLERGEAEERDREKREKL